MIKKNIEVIINSKTRQVSFEDNFLGLVGENLQGNIIFKFEDEFVDGVARLEIEQDGKKYVITEVEKVENIYQLVIKSSLLTSSQVYMQLVITESENEKGIPIFMSKVFYMNVYESIQAEAKIPDEYESWIDAANQKLLEIDNLDIDIENSVITITRKDGTTKTENVKGEKGEKGDAGSVKFIIVNELPTENIDESAMYLKRIVIEEGQEEEEQNKYEEYIFTENGWELVGTAKVEVDLTEYVKKTDYGTYTKAGIFRPTNGLTITGTNKDGIGIAKATNTQIDGKTDNYAPIVPSSLDYAVKKGMTTNALEWTDEEKASARKLIGALATYKKTSGRRAIVCIQPNADGGTEIITEMASSGQIPSGYGIPVGDSVGRIAVATPTADNHATNKAYVDGLHVTLTQAEYDALATKDENVYYNIVEE